jgi:hypothetical protein
MSRNSALTDAVYRGILAAIRAGNDNLVAATAQGVDEATYYRWLERGAEAAPCIKRFAPSAANPIGALDWKACDTADHPAGACPGNQQYRDFRDAVDQARGEFEVLMSGYLAKAAPTNPKYALALLERRVPERWSPKRPITERVAARDGLPFHITLIQSDRSESEVAEITRLLGTAGATVPDASAQTAAGTSDPA